MVQPYNDKVTTKQRFLDMFPIKRELTTKNFRYTKHKFYVTQITIFETIMINIQNKYEIMIIIKFSNIMKHFF